MRKLLWSVAAVLGAVAPLGAAPPDPVVTARLRSLNDLTGYAEYLGGVVGQADPAKQAAQLVRGLADPDRGIEGVDPARPVGLYGVMTPDVVNSYAVVIVPVADEKALLDLLTGRLNLDPKKGEGGIYSLTVPNVPVPLFFRFAKKSAYVTARSADPLADDKLVAPADLFAGEEPAALAVRLFPGRVPAEVRKVFLGQVELQLAESEKKRTPEKEAGGEMAYQVGQQGAFAALTALVSETAEVNVRVGIDPKADDLSAEVVVTPKGKTAFAGLVRGAGKATGAAAGRLAPANALFVGGFRLDLPKSVQPRLDAGVDAFIADAVAKAKKDERKPAKKFLSAFAPTLKSRVIDLGVAVVPGAEPGTVGAVVELRVVGGEGIEKAVKQLADLIPDDKADFSFDDEEVNGVSLHEVELGDAADLEKATGSASIYLGTSDDRLLIAVGADAKLLKAAAKKDAGPVPVLKADLSASRVLRVAEKGLPPEALDKLAAEHVGEKVRGQDAVKLAVTGGDALTARLTIKGKAVRFVTAVDQAKKEK